MAISYCRAEGRRIRNTLPLEEYGLDIAAADQLFDDASDNMCALQKLINALDELNRAPILLYLEGLAGEEIADIVGIGANNVSIRITRLKAKLQAEFNLGNKGNRA